MNTNDTILEKLKQDPQFSSQVSRWHTLPMREGIYSPIPDDLSPKLLELLKTRGIEQIYSHQLAAYQAARRG